jgi:hypothetical protein
MKRKWILTLLLLILATAALGVFNASAHAGYSLDWWTVDGGGGNSSGGDYALSGTLGQPDAGTASGGTYILNGGFWSADAQGSTTTPSVIYLPVIYR